MAAKTDCETSGCAFQWKIENISHCWNSYVHSPVFTAGALKDTKWVLLLYPKGTNSDNKLEFFLQKQEAYSGDKSTCKVNYMLAFVDKEGSVLQEIDGLSNKTWNRAGFLESLARDRVFVTERELFLPEDTLTVQCTLWEMGEKPVNICHVFGRTTFKVNRRSFLRRIEKFSTLKSGLQGKFDDGVLDFVFVLNEGLYFEKKLGIKVNLSKRSIKYFSLKTSVVDSVGGKENGETHEYFEDDLERRIVYAAVY